MRFAAIAVALLLFLGLFAPPLAAQDADKPAAAPEKVRRWESNLSGGWVSNGRIGLVKSFWWHPWSRALALGLSFDYIYEAMPISVGVALNAPIPYAVPFVCAGAGTTLTVGGLTYYGGGLKIRLARRFGLIAEYRKYTYQHDTNTNPQQRETVNADYIGGGIAWIY